MKLAALAVFLFLASAAIADDSNRIGVVVDLRQTQLEVIWVESTLDMRELLAANGIPINKDSEKGFSLRGHHAQTGQDVCVVYALKPQEINDKHTLVLGHEVLHCLWGAYH